MIKYKKQTKAGKELKADHDAQIKKNIDETIAKARHLLNMPEFIEYKAQFIQLREDAVEFLLNMPCRDITEFGYTAKVLLDEIATLNLIIDKVKTKAKV